MKLQPLTLDDKPMFDTYTRRTYPGLSSYAFAPLYIWRDHFTFYWGELAGHLCVFAKQNDDYFMPILPIPYRVGNCGYLNVVRKTYQFMLESSRNPHIVRIENVPKGMLSLFQENGFSATLKEPNISTKQGPLAD